MYSQPYTPEVPVKMLRRFIAFASVLVWSQGLQARSDDDGSRVAEDVELPQNAIDGLQVTAFRDTSHGIGIEMLTPNGSRMWIQQ